MATDYGNYAEADIRAQVRGVDSFFYQCVWNPKTGRKSITRGWRIDSHLQERVRDFLFEYGDGDQASPLNENAEITDPAIADNIRQPGTWRITRVFQVPDYPDNIYETMVSTLDDGDADLMGLSQNGCMYKVTTSYYYDRDSVPDAGDFPASSGVVWRVDYVRRDDETGLYSYQVEKRESITVKMGEWTSAIDSSQRTGSTVWKNVKEGQDGTLVGLDPMDRVAGLVKRESRNKNDDCTHDIRQDITAVVDQVGGSEQRRADQSESVVTHTEAASLPAAPSLVAGQIRETGGRPTEAGRYATTDRTVIALDQTGGSGEKRADRTSVTTTHTQNTSPVTANRADGTIVQYGNAPTEFGRNRTTVETITAIDQQGGAKDDRHDRTSVTETHTQNAAPVQASKSAGTIVQVSNRPTEFGLTATVEETITAIDQPVSQTTEYRADRHTHTDTHTEKNGTEADAARTSGKIVQVSSRPDEFGRYKTVREEITAENQTAKVKEDRADRRTQSETNTFSDNGSFANSFPSRVVGQITQRNSTPTEFPDRYRNTEETITAIDQPETNYDQNAHRSVVVQTHTHDVALGDPQRDDERDSGKTFSVQTRETEFGDHATVSETVTCHPQSKLITWTDDDNRKHYHYWYINQEPGHGQDWVDDHNGEDVAISASAQTNIYGKEDGTISATDSSNAKSDSKIDYYLTAKTGWTWGVQTHEVDDGDGGVKTQYRVVKSKLHWVGDRKYDELLKKIPQDGVIGQPKISSYTMATRKTAWLAQYCTDMTITDWNDSLDGAKAEAGVN